MAKLFENVLMDAENLSRQNRHRLRACRAAYRLLQGSVIAGATSIESAKNILPEIMKYEIDEKGNKLVSDTFAEDYFREIEGKREALRRMINKKYSVPIDIGNRKVLIIDDQITTTGWKQVLGALLTDNIVCADSVKQAVDQTDRHRNSLLCAFVDLRLPTTEEQGIALIGQLREKHESLPIIVFSVTDSVVYAKRCFEVGAWDYFPKEPEPQLYRSSLQYYISFRDIIERIIRYDVQYRQMLWNPIQSLAESFESKRGEQFTVLRDRMVFHLKKAYKFLIQDKVDKYSLTFAQVNHHEEAVLQCALALEVFVTMILLERKIFHQKAKRTKQATGEWKLELEATLEPGATLGDKLDLLKKNQTKTSLSKEWFDGASRLNRLRTEVVHSTFVAASKGKKIKVTVKAVSPKDVFDTLFRTLTLVTARY